MSESCPVLTPQQRQQVEIIDRAQQAMMAAIMQAVDAAHGQSAQELAALDLADPPPARDYFAAVAHQHLFLRLCGADPKTFEGGDPEIAAELLDNGRAIAEHYWGAGQRSD